MPCPCREVSRKEKEVSIDAVERQNGRKECGIANMMMQGGGTQTMSVAAQVRIVGSERGKEGRKEQRKTVFCYFFVFILTLLVLFCFC